MSFYAPRFWPTWLLLALLRLATLLPLRTQYALGRQLGRLLYRAIRRRRRIVEVNLELCFPEKSAPERQQMAVEVFENNAIGMLETANAWWSSAARFENRCTIEGLEHLEAAKANGKGILLTAAHYSTLDLGGFLLGQHLDFYAVYRPHNNPLFDHFICKGRNRFIKQLIDNESSRGIIRNLRNGNIVWFAPDQDMGPKQSIEVPFFGIPAATVPSASKLARLGKAQVMIFAHYRTSEDGHYLLKFHPVMSDFPSDDEVSDTTRVNLALEQAIREHPTQYMWVHRRFKTAFDGSDKASLYN